MCRLCTVGDGTASRFHGTQSCSKVKPTLHWGFVKRLRRRTLTPACDGSNPSSPAITLCLVYSDMQGDYVKEEWKEIIGFHDYYVSNFGRIKSYRRSKNGIILKQQVNKYGYCWVSISDDNNKKHYVQVHRAVLKAFDPIDNMDQFEVNHKDENKSNNCLSNLEWSTHFDNVMYGTGRIRCNTPQKMKIRCIQNGIVYNSMREAADELGINYGNLSSHCSGKLKTVNGLSFEVIDSGSRHHYSNINQKHNYVE